MRGYSYAFDAKSDTSPPKTMMTTATSLQLRDNIAPGTWFLHVRACNADGQWGPAGHVKVVLEARAADKPGELR